MNRKGLTVFADAELQEYYESMLSAAQSLSLTPEHRVVYALLCCLDRFHFLDGEVSPTQEDWPTTERTAKIVRELKRRPTELQEYFQALSAPLNRFAITVRDRLLAEISFAAEPTSTGSKTSPIEIVYPNGDPIRLGDRVESEHHDLRGVIEEICLPMTQHAEDYSVDVEGGVLVREDPVKHYGRLMLPLPLEDLRLVSRAK